MRSLLFVIVCSLPACAQFVSVGAGGVFSQDLKATAGGGQLGAAISDFSKAGIITADAGIGFLPFLSGAVHYSFTRPELFLRRGDAFGSSAVLGVGTHTVTLDGRVRSPEAGGLRVYGFAGGGFSRTNVDIKRVVEVPFRGTPGSETFSVFTFGGGLEQKIVPLVRVKVEVRDYLSPIPSQYFLPGGLWHRVVVVGGLTIGR